MGNLLEYLKGHFKARGEASARAESSAVAPTHPPPVHDVSAVQALETPDIGTVVCVEEVSNARFFINDLFRRRFGSNAPDYPRHFVAFHAASPHQYTAIGYVHFSPFEDSWLCGGMVMDDRAYRRIPAHHRAAIKGSGGVAEIMLKDTFARLRDAPAIWGYVGDKLAEAVDLRAGFVHTTAEHVMVVWNRELPIEEKAARLARVVTAGPF